MGGEDDAADAGECGADADHQARRGCEPAVHDGSNANAQHDGVRHAGNAAAQVEQPQLVGILYGAEQDEDQGLDRSSNQDDELAVALSQPYAGERGCDDARDVVNGTPQGDLGNLHAHVLGHCGIVDACAAVQDCRRNAADQAADNNDRQVVHEAFFHQLRALVLLLYRSHLISPFHLR